MTDHEARAREMARPLSEEEIAMARGTGLWDRWIATLDTERAKLRTERDAARREMRCQEHWFDHQGSATPLAERPCTNPATVCREHFRGLEQVIEAMDPMAVADQVDRLDERERVAKAAIDAARRDAYREAEVRVLTWLGMRRDFMPDEAVAELQEICRDLHRRATTAPGGEA